MSALWHRRLRRKGFALSDPLQVNVFREQLNRLIDTHPKKLTNGTVVKGLAERGCVISPPYLSQLRTGARTNPSREVVDALAGFFDVPPGHFFIVSDPMKADEVRAQDARVVGRIGGSRHTRSPDPGQRPVRGFPGPSGGLGCEAASLRSAGNGPARLTRLCPTGPTTPQSRQSDSALMAPPGEAASGKARTLLLCGALVAGAVVSAFLPEQMADADISAGQRVYVSEALCDELCVAFIEKSEVRCSAQPDCASVLSDKSILVDRLGGRLSAETLPDWAPRAMDSIDKFRRTVADYDRAQCSQTLTVASTCSFIAASAEYHFQAVNLLLSS